MPTKIELSRFSDVIQKSMADWDIPGLTVGVLQDGIVESLGFGTANHETSSVTHHETVFQVGSITKVFTATLVMGLVEDGLLDLDTPVHTYLPDLRLADDAALQQISIRHLLTHTGGFEGDRFDDHGNGDDALGRCVADLHSLEQITPVGFAMSYCNAGFNLAGFVVEQVLGMPFEQAMGERVFAPLGLERTTFFAHEAILHRAAAGHHHPPDKHVPVVARPYPLARAANPAGGIIADVSDVLRFTEAHLGNDHMRRPFPSRSYLDAMCVRQVAVDSRSDWGLGWSIQRIGGTDVIGHTGATNGFNARLGMIPSQRFAFALLSNSGRGAVAIRQIERVLLRDLCDLDTDDAHPIVMPVDRLQALAGTYQARLNEVTLSVDGDSLMMRSIGINPFTDERTERQAVRVAPLSHTELLVLDGEQRGTRMQIVDGPGGSGQFLRASSRLSRRQ